jgi:preprotein translocase subunit SecF
MATVVITGRDISLSFTGGTDIEAQATSAVLTKTNVRETYQTLDGEAYKTTNVEGTFELSMLADWGKANSVCEALWTAAETAPDTDISITLTTATGASFVFPVMPEFPTAGGAGTDAQTVDFSFKVSRGEVTETFS